MPLDEYLSLVNRFTKNYDRASAIRAYQSICKEAIDYDEEVVCQYILQHLPDDGMFSLRSILNDYGTTTDNCVIVATKWLKGNGKTWKDTLCGVYVTADVAQMLRAFLLNAIPVKDVFVKVCGGFDITPTHAMYANFYKYSNKYLYKTRYHPFCSDEWFWFGNEQDLYKLIAQWYMTYCMDVPSDVNGYMSVLEAATSMGIAPKNLIKWLWNHRDNYICRKGQCLVDKNTVANLCNQWAAIQPVWPMLKQLLDQIPLQARMSVQTMLRSWLDNNNHDWLLPAEALPQQLEGVLYTTQPSICVQALQAEINSYPTLPINCLKEITGLSAKLLKLKAKAGAIHAQTDHKQNWYISKNEYQRVVDMHVHYLSLDALISPLVNKTDSVFDLGSYSHRTNLINYCNSNDWWGIEYINCDDTPMDGHRFGIAVPRKYIGLLQDKLFLWVQGFGRSYSDKFQFVISKYANRFPCTTKHLIAYEQEAHPADKAFLDMIHLLFDLIPKDIGKMDDTEITQLLIEPFSQRASLTSCDILSDVLVFAGYTQGSFMFARTGGHIDVSAYAMQDYAVMLAHVANDDVIQEAQLVSKAVCNKKYADLWLYVALHMYAAWRSTDYVRMIAPTLPYAPEETLERVKTGKIKPDKLISIAEYFLAINSLTMNMPNKTKGISGVPKLYICCPHSCLQTFGTILAIATAHYMLSPDSKSLVNPVKHWTVIKHFFGPEFLVACGNRSFSGRRANKSLLQNIELTGRDDQNMSPAVSYYLASIVRSHKLSYGKLSETTDIYLKDAAFSGLTPEFVAYQMLERGVCSFITDVMLKQCYGDQYTRLSVAQQTEVINCVGLTPMQVTDVLHYIQQAEDHAAEIIQSVCQSKESIQHALEQIAIGHGTGKDSDVYCLCKAVGMDCQNKSRLNCMGCRYEIRTKALLLQYVVNHQRLMHLDGLREVEIMRRMYLCKTTTYPAIQEILLHLENSSTESYLLYKQLIQEVNDRGIAGNSTW